MASPGLPGAPPAAHPGARGHPGAVLVFGFSGDIRVAVTLQGLLLAVLVAGALLGASCRLGGKLRGAMQVSGARAGRSMLVGYAKKRKGTDNVTN